MEPDSDDALIRAFATSRSEHAFRALVDRHIDHVHSVAHRVARNHALAADVAQQVFTKLATDHAKIPHDVSLSAWLHVKTRSLAIDMVRSEEARSRREQEFQKTAAMNLQDVKDWGELEPLIDEVVGALSAKDRDAILLRFYQKQSHASVGQMLGVSEDAARMRINRALEKVRAQLASRGIATTTAALALTLPANAVTAAPPTLAATVSSTAVAASSAATTGGAAVTSLLAIAKSYFAMAAIVAVALPIVLLQFATHSRLIKEVRQLREPVAVKLPGDQDFLNHNSVAKEITAADTSPVTLRSILAQSDPAKRTHALLNYIRVLAPDDIPGTLDELRVISSDWDPEAGMLVHILLARWAQEDPDAAYLSLSALDLRNMTDDASSILGGLSALAPGRAANWLASADNALVNFPNMGHILAGTIAKEWVRQDQAAALQWAQSLPDNQRTGAYTGILGSLATSDPETASTLAMQLDADDGRSYLVGEIAGAWAKTSPQSALNWVTTLDAQDRDKGMTKALASWGESDPVAASSYIDQLSADEQIEPHVASLAGVWAARAPAQAAVWVASRSEGSGKNTAMRAVMWNWTTRDPQAASTWLAEQPVSASRDRGINGLAEAAFDSDPASALTWATAISNRNLRSQSVEAGLRTWLHRAPEAAQDWAKQNGIPLPEPIDSEQHQE